MKNVSLESYGKTDPSWVSIDTELSLELSLMESTSSPIGSVEDVTS